MNKVITLGILLLALIQMGCSSQLDPRVLDEGVSWELAQYRCQTISQLHYDLSFTIPEDKEKDVKAREQIRFNLSEKGDVILDFRETEDKLHDVWVNGDSCDYCLEEDHIVIPETYVRKGENVVDIRFTAGSQSLNRREDYVYTLFVPDRARTVFPCFDQPNLKATFDLTLTIPQAWTAVSNGPTDSIPDPSADTSLPKGYKRLHSCIDRPIPTYLFAFAAGKFDFQQFEEDGYTIGAYHRETDSLRIAQLPDIIRQVAFSLRWQEDFTGVPYPFPKYDLVILPGFQFGGMEHVGATFYNDNTIFLPQHPTPDEQLRRTELISHETSHMWFGDAVTMDWFDDVWTKEVFANYFAAEITEPLFPDLNHDLNWLKTYVSAAVSQDRTEGRTSIRQPLSNLRYAGLIYNNIIYNKAPVMMRRMVETMGKEAFREGIQAYVRKYLYGNATWNDLIAILDSVATRHTPGLDLKAFSRQWVDQEYWPHIQANSFLEGRDGKTYGYIELNAEQLDSLMDYWPHETDATARQALLMNLNENYLNNKLKATQWLQFLTGNLAQDWDELTTSSLINNMYEPLLELENQGQAIQIQSLESTLWKRMEQANSSATQTQLLRLLMKRATSPQFCDKLYRLWQEEDHPLLSVNDYMTLSYELALRLPGQADSIIHCQRQRLTNPDRQAQFDYISRAVSPRPEALDSLFQSLRQAKNRRIEPWTLTVLSYLNHPLCQERSLRYIEPALELLPEIQRTGDIFFPANWCSSLLAGHRSPEALEHVRHFLKTHTDYPPLITKKILQSMFLLERAGQNGAGSSKP